MSLLFRFSEVKSEGGGKGEGGARKRDETYSVHVMSLLFRFSEVDFHYQASRGVVDLKNLGISVTPRHLDLVYKNPVRQQQPTRRYTRY